MTIKEIKRSDVSFQTLVEKKGNVFLSQDWLSLYDDKLIVYGLFSEEQLIGSFLLYEFSKFGFNFIITPPFSPYNSLVLLDDSKAMQALSMVLTFLNSKRAVFTRLALPSQFSVDNKSDLSFSYQAGVTYVLPLSEIQEVQRLYHPKRRQQIRRAINDGLVTKKISDPALIIELVKKTFDRQGKKFDKRMVELILNKFNKHSNAYAFGAFQREAPLAVYFCIHDDKTAYYLLGGYDKTKKHIGAGALAMDACIQEAKNRGLNYFDFEGSMVPSIARYFKEFGGSRTEYSIYQKENFIGKSIRLVKKIIWK